MNDYKNIKFKSNEDVNMSALTYNCLTTKMDRQGEKTKPL